VPQWIVIVLRTLITIIALFAITKVLGKRQLGELSYFEYITGITIGSIASYASIDLQGNWYYGFLAIFVWAIIVYALGFLTLKSKVARDIIQGKGVVLIKEGKILEDNLGKRDVLDKIIIFDDHIEFFLKGGKIKNYIRQYPKGSYNKHCFSRKLQCGECGSTFVRMNCSKKGYDKCWMCASKKSNRDACSIKYITEDELIKASISILGTKNNYEMRFYCEIEKAVVFNDKVNYLFKKDQLIKVKSL